MDTLLPSSNYPHALYWNCSFSSRWLITKRLSYVLFAISCFIIVISFFSVAPFIEKLNDWSALSSFIKIWNKKKNAFQSSISIYLEICPLICLPTPLSQRSYLFAMVILLLLLAQSFILLLAFISVRHILHYSIFFFFSRLRKC